MKEREFSSIVGQLNTLLLTANALMCESGLMENAGKKYGFYLMKVESGDFKSGFYYAVRYKDPETKKWIPTKKSTGTDNETEANAFAINNRDAIIQEYKERKERRAKKDTGESFFRMLREYYRPESKYLLDDKVNNKRDLTLQQQRVYNSFIERHLIPYLQQKGITSIHGVTRDIYSGLKIYLQEKNFKNKTINNNLLGFIRILQYHERNDIIAKLPFSKGTSLLRITKEDKANANTPALLPTEFLAGISEPIADGSRKSRLHLMAIIALATGMRDSEVGRIKVEDIKRIKDIQDAYYIRVFNNKTDFYNTNDTDEYRKMPLHPFIVGQIKNYIKANEKTKADYIFGKPKIDENTKQIDGVLHRFHCHNAIVELYKKIKRRESKTLILDFDTEKLEAEMKQKRIVFYSLRHTFQTLLLTMYQDKIILTDYFMGHKPDRAMLANYLHINRVDETTFWNEYGKYLVDFQAQFIPSMRQVERHDFVREYSTDLFNKSENGSVDIIEVFNRLLGKLKVPNDAEWNGLLDTDPASFFQKALKHNGLDKDDSPDARMIREVLIPYLTIRQNGGQEGLRDENEDDLFDSV